MSVTRDPSHGGAPRLAVYTAASWKSEAPLEILGELSEDEGRWLFRPRFPFRSGLAYVARLTPAEGAPVLLEFAMPAARAGERTRVTAIRPAGEVPANLLRMYVHFSAPMDPRGIVDHVRLLDADGRALPLAFVEIDDGLWDAERRRLTLLLHPGRIKQGVGPNRALGPPLREGARYTLVIDGAARDADGFPLGASARFELIARADDRERPAPRSWTLRAPDVGRAPLEVEFDELLDTALVERYLAVVDGGGERVAGNGTARDGGRGWRFVPDSPWKAGAYRVLVHPHLEDTAGNRPQALFDAASGERTLEDKPAVIALPFSVP